MSPKLIQTSQKTTSNYKVSSTMVFLIKENKFRLEMQLKDSYVFDGKKRDPNTTWEIASNQINENYVGNQNISECIYESGDLLKGFGRNIFSGNDNIFWIYIAFFDLIVCPLDQYFS